MKEMILRVVKCGECFTVKSEKSEGGVLNKRTLVLQELGGKYENCYVVSALGNLASIQFSEGDLVIATLRFQSREYNGQMFMETKRSAWRDLMRSLDYARDDKRVSINLS